MNINELNKLLIEYNNNLIEVNDKQIEYNDNNDKYIDELLLYKKNYADDKIKIIQKSDEIKNIISEFDIKYELLIYEKNIIMKLIDELDKK